MPHSDIRRRQNQGLAVIDMHVPRNTRLAGVEALDRMVNGEPPELPDEDDADDDEDPEDDM